MPHPNHPPTKTIATAKLPMATIATGPSHGVYRRHAIPSTPPEEREKVLVYSHLSHTYPQGSSIYTTYIFRMGDNYECAFCRWQKIKKAGAHETMACGGTISHQHGVGMDHIDYLPMEKGDLGIAAIRTLCNLYDPREQMNPNKLLISHVTKRKESQIVQKL